MRVDAGGGEAIEAREVVRHQLAGLAFRFAHAVADAPGGFSTFEAGHGVRTPTEIVHHTADVLELGRQLLIRDRPERSAGARGEAFDVDRADTDRAWSDAIEAFYRALERLDAVFRDANDPLDPRRLRMVLHGPLLDAATHVGQIALLRREAGAPVVPVSYVHADVRSGRIRPNEMDGRDGTGGSAGAADADDA